MSGVLDGLLSVDIVDGPVMVTVFVAAATALVVVLARRPTRWWLSAAALGLVSGIAVAVGLWLVCIRWLNLYGTSLGLENDLWIAGALGAVGIAVANFFRSGWRRKAVAGVAIVAFLAAGTVAVNADYGVNRTLGNLLSVVVPKPIRLTPPSGSGSYDVRLWSSWTAPASMPSRGRTGTAVIPATLSHFAARPAGIYLPPAALVPGAPRLPVVIMMMGQPGNPDPGPIGSVLDAFARRHHGLAPIVVVADQLGPQIQDTLCLNTRRYGDVETYVTGDVVHWIETDLNVTTDHRYWTVAGYSNGGQCALSFGVKHPDLFGDIIDVSGEEFPASEHPDDAVRDVFGGDRAAYDAVKPLNILQHRSLPSSTVVFTASHDDPHYLAVARKSAQVARNAHMNVKLVELPAGGHTVHTLVGGLTAAFGVLYPVLGLSAPGSPGAT